jgi:hypothetical protein
MLKLPGTHMYTTRIFRIRVHVCLFIFQKKSSLYGLIGVCMLIKMLKMTTLMPFIFVYIQHNIDTFYPVMCVFVEIKLSPTFVATKCP